MKANQVKDVERIKPNVAGNKVYLASLPEYVEGEKGNSYKLSFIDAETKKAEFTTTQFDPFATKADAKESIVTAGWNKLFRFYRAFMDDATYDKFADIDHADLKSLIAIGNKMIAQDALNTEATIIIGYSLYNGYIGLPAFEHYITTKYASRDLEYPMNDIHPVRDFEPKKAPASSSPAASKPDEEDDDEV